MMRVVWAVRVVASLIAASCLVSVSGGVWNGVGLVGVFAGLVAAVAWSVRWVRDA